ncbi:MAG: hypothetical protein U0P45_02765 [Acidimicrobiales bacterium]
MGQAAAIVVGVILVVGLVQAAIWVPLGLRWKRRNREFWEGFDADLAASGEQVARGPEDAIYRGATGTYGSVKGNGRLVLTDRRLVFRKATGGVVEVPRARITGTHEAKAFLGSRVGGRTHLVITTDDPAELGFFVDDLDAWASALESARPA